MSNIIVGGSGDMTFRSTALIWTKVIGTIGTGQKTRKEKLRGNPAPSQANTCHLSHANI